MNILESLVATVVILSTPFVRGKDFPCTYYSGECKTHMEKDGFYPPTLEVSCQCKYRRDVSRNLTALAPIMCPFVPQTEKDIKLNHTILRIENCDVEEQVFPLEILRVLRRSKNFTVIVKDAKSLRLESDTFKENGTQPIIQAKFEDSRISGIGAGWFTGSKMASVKFEDCKIGIIESEFISNHEPDANVDVEFENTEITTIKSFAFLFPKHGSLTIERGQIDQLESDAIDGGEDVRFDAVIIGNIQNSAINIYGLASFTLEASIIAKMSKDAIIEHNNQGRMGSKFHSEYHVGEVVIKRNKFIVVDGDSFSGLCRERFLTFEDNFFHNASTTLALKSAHCSIERDWWTSISNNGFSCNKCANIFGAMNEQVCAVYESGWCLCDSKVISDAWKTNSEKDDNDEDKSPCRYVVKDYIDKKCSGVQAASEYLSYCKMYSHKVPVRHGTSTWVQDSGTSSMSAELCIIICMKLVIEVYTRLTAT